MPSARVDRDHPGALLGVAVLGHLVEVGLGEEAGVGHQALVDRAELVDAELGVGDEAAVPALVLLAQQQVPQDLLEGGVAEADLVDVGGGLGLEQVGAQRAEGEPVDVLAVVVPRDRRRVVPVVDEPEQHAERLVEVGARPGRCWVGSSTSTRSRSRSRL